MIAYLSGKIKIKHEKNFVVNVNGVGYLVNSTKGLLESVLEDQEIELYIHTNVREDDISLYGFKTQDEWKFFKLLLTVSGIGPKSALEILNAPMQKVRQAIAKKEVALLVQFPGIGRKTAERIIVDLQGKIKEEIIEEDSEPGAQERGEEIIQALVSLGYHRHHVIQGLKKIPAEVQGEESVIKYFLQNI